MNGHHCEENYDRPLDLCLILRQTNVELAKKDNIRGEDDKFMQLFGQF